MAGDGGLFARISAGLGRFRGLFVPFGLFAILAVGIHTGSDHVDDATFTGLSFLDAIVDDLLGGIIGAVWPFFGASDETTQAAIFATVDLVDMEVKDTAARFIALMVELLADVILALPVFLYRERDVSLVGIVRKTLADPTVLRIFAPISAAMASVAGLAIITREVQVATSAGLLAVDASPGFAGWVSSAFGMLALILVAWRLGWVVTVAAARWAEIKAVDDQRNQVKELKRILRGWFTGLVTFPICVWAFIDAFALIGGVRALLPG